MKLLAIDGNSILNRAFYGVRPLSTKDGVPTNAIFGFLNILLKLQKEYTPDAVAVAFDVARKNFRHDLFADYKINRKGMPDELRTQLPLLQSLLTALGLKLCFCEGYEGDDILGTLAAAACKEGWQCIVSTGDRDSLQLVSDCVSVSLEKTKEQILYTPARVQEEFGFDPIHIADLKGLMGDTSDGIPGVKSIGEKTAMRLIQECGDLETLYDRLEELQLTPRVKGLLLDGREMAFLSRKLAVIRSDVPIETRLDLYVPAPMDTDEVDTQLRRLELFSFFDKFALPAPTVSRSVPEGQIRRFAEAEGVFAPSPAQTVSLLFSEEGLLLETAGRLYRGDDDTLSLLLRQGNPIVTHEAKRLYRRAEALSLPAPNLLFDTELAAYLLQPDAKGYPLSTLLPRYLEDISVDAPEPFLQVAGLSPLREVLEAALEQAGMTRLFLEIELPLCGVLAGMESEGFGIDREGIARFGESLEAQIEGIKETVYMLAGEEFPLNSTRELGRILFEKLGLPAGRKTKTGYSTDAEVLESLLNKHPIIPEILRYRQLTKLHSTYVVGLLRLVGSDGRVHSTFHQTETRTGRISSSEPNVQNIPVRTELGSELRRFFVARPGFTLIDADYSQIELRILAHLSGDRRMCDAFFREADIHAITASQVFGHPLEDLPAELRRRAKAINFGMVYGISAYSLSQDIGVPVAVAKRYMDAYFATYSGVAAYMKQVVEEARDRGFVTTLYGRVRPLPDIHASNFNQRSFAERVALNTPVQGTAADIIKLAMIRVRDRLQKEYPDARLVLQVHDELIVEAPVLCADAVKKLVQEEMEQAASLSVPLVADAHIGENWLVAKG